MVFSHPPHRNIRTIQTRIERASSTSAAHAGGFFSYVDTRKGEDRQSRYRVGVADFHRYVDPEPSGLSDTLLQLLDIDSMASSLCLLCELKYISARRGRSRRLGPFTTIISIRVRSLREKRTLELQSDLPLGPDISANVCLVEARQPCRPAWSPKAFQGLDARSHLCSTTTSYGKACRSRS